MACGGSSVVKFESGLVCSDSGVLGVGDVWVDRGTLVDPLRLFYVDKRRPDVVVDCRGLVIAPGFIDIQINGQQMLELASYVGLYDVLHASKCTLQLFVCNNFNE